MNTIFGLKNEIQAYHIENEALTFNPSNFSSIKYFLYKFKTLRLLFESCKEKKEDEALIYGIIPKLGPLYSIFVSTFHPTRESLIYARTKYKYPSSDSFCDSLIRELCRSMRSNTKTSINYFKNTKKFTSESVGSFCWRFPSFLVRI